MFVVSTILVAGVGGMALSFGQVTITAIATALILGILVNLLVNIGKKKNVNESVSPEGSEVPEAETQASEPAEQAEDGKKE